MVQGGVSTGRTSTDNCEVLKTVTEAGPLNAFCHVDTNFLTQVKLLGTYTVPESRRAVLAARSRACPGRR